MEQSDLANRVQNALQEMVPHTSSDVQEVPWKEGVCVHVESRYEGKGYFRIAVIVPWQSEVHEFAVDQLRELNNVDTLFNTIETALEQEYKKFYPDLEFNQRPNIDASETHPYNHHVFRSRDFFNDGGKVKRAP